MKIYTRTGDEGDTSLWGGKRVSKADLRIKAYGTVDELNSWLGLLASIPGNEIRKDYLHSIQSNLFIIGANLAADPEKTALKLPSFNDSDLQLMESKIDEMENDLPSLTSFILPGGNQESSYTHISRCVCRRAEREVIDLASHDEVPGWIIKYLNRLSDFLFVLARKTCIEHGGEEIKWHPK